MPRKAKKHHRSNFGPATKTAKATKYRQAESRRTQRAILEEEQHDENVDIEEILEEERHDENVVDFDEEMSSGSNIDWTETACDALFATVPQQQLQSRSFGLTYSETITLDRSSQLVSQQKRCAENIASIEGSRTVTTKQAESLSESTARKRRRKTGKRHWRKAKQGENRRFEISFHNAITSLIENDPSFCKWGQERRYEQICKSICTYNHNITDDVVGDDDDTFIKTLIVTMKPIIRNILFHPLDILKSMDLSGGILGYEGIKILRGVETRGVKFLRSILPSTGELQRAAALVEKVADIECPLKKEILDLGDKKVESISLDIPTVIKLLIDAFGLKEVALVRPVALVQTMDGANLSKNENHTSMGIRLIDIETKDPVTNEFLFKDEGLGKIQSRDWCIPVQTIFSNETKEIMPLFDHQFQTTKALGTTDTDSILSEAGYKPLNFTAAGDMSNRWKALKAGGGVGVAGVAFPCECCALRAKKWCRPNSKFVRDNCDVCRLIYRELLLPNGEANPYYIEGEDQPDCYHHPMLTEENRPTRMKELEEYLNKLSNFSEIEQKTKFNYHDDPLYPTANKQNDPKSIHFTKYNNNPAQKIQYEIFLISEIALRQKELPMPFTVESMRTMLKELLIMERLIAELEVGKRRDIDQDNGIFRLMDAVPCLLHAEIRVYIKIIELLLIEGLTNCTTGQTYAHETSQNKRRKLFLTDLHSIMNKEILGTGAEGMSASWRLPLEGPPNKEEIGNISFNKNRARKILESMEDLLITVCVVPNRQLEWKQSVQHVTSAFKKARKHAKYTDIDLIDFQYHCDQFNVHFLSLHGANVSTNYIHYLSSGHFYEYMCKYRSLYIYSQESWEATNNLIKSFYFRRTQRGGFCGKHGKKVSYCL